MLLRRRTPAIIVCTPAERAAIIRQWAARARKYRKEAAREARKLERQRARREAERKRLAQEEAARKRKEDRERKLEEKRRRKMKRARRRARKQEAQIREWTSFDINDVEDEGMRKIFQEMIDFCAIPEPPPQPPVHTRWEPYVRLPYALETRKPEGSLAPNIQTVRFPHELEYAPNQWMGGCFELAGESSFGRPGVQMGDTLIYTDHATEMYLMLVRNIVARATGPDKLPAGFQYPVFESPELAFAADLASDPGVLRELDAIPYDKAISQKGKYAARVAELVVERLKRDPSQLDSMFLSIDPVRARESTLRHRPYLEQTARAGLVSHGPDRAPRFWSYDPGRPGMPAQYGVTREHAMATFYYLYCAGTQNYDKDIGRDLHGSVSYRVCTSPFAISNSTPFKPSVIRSPRNKGIALMGVSPESALPCVSNHLRPGVGAAFATTNAVYCYKDFALPDLPPQQERSTCAFLNDAARQTIHTALHHTFANIVERLDPAAEWFPETPLFRFIALARPHGLVLSIPTVAESLLVSHVINIAFVNLEPFVRAILTAIMRTAAHETNGNDPAWFAEAIREVCKRYRPEAIFRAFREIFARGYAKYSFLDAQFMAAQNAASASGKQPTLATLEPFLSGARLLDFCKLEFQKLHADAACSMGGLTGSMLSYTFIVMYADSIQDEKLLFHACQALYTHIFSVRKITEELETSYRPASPRLARLPSLHRISFLFATAYWIARHRDRMRHAPLASLPAPTSNYCYCHLAPCPIVHTTAGMASMLATCKRYAVVAEPRPIPAELGGGVSYARGFEAQNTAHCEQKVYVTERIPLQFYRMAREAAGLLRIVADPVAFPAAPVLRARAPIPAGTLLGVLAGEERVVRVGQLPLALPRARRLYYHDSVPYLWQTYVTDPARPDAAPRYVYQLFAGRYGNYLRFVLNAPAQDSGRSPCKPTRGASARALGQTTQHDHEPNCTFAPLTPEIPVEWMPHEHCETMCRAGLGSIPRFWVLRTTADIDVNEVLVSDTTRWFIHSGSKRAPSGKRRVRKKATGSKAACGPAPRSSPPGTSK